MKTAVKERRHQLKFFEIALLIGLAVFLTSGALALRTQNDLAEKVVRLHVLANSDSEEDQAVKLRVRDAVLAYERERMADVSTAEEARQRLMKDGAGLLTKKENVWKKRKTTVTAATLPKQF